MGFEKILFEDEIESKVRFNKQMMTVYDLSYILIDFQAVINNLTEIIYDNIEEKYRIIEEKAIIERIYDSTKEENKAFRNEMVGPEHPRWQKEIEENIESMIFESNRRVANVSPRKTPGYKQTTSRKFNKKYQMNLRLNGFSKGSLFLDLVNSLIVSILTEFLKELVVKKTGNQNAININVYNNQYILIDGEAVKRIPKDSCVCSAIKVNLGSNQSQLDVQKCIHDVVESSKPDENIEESVRRLFRELEKNGIVNEQIIYDERGIKTAVRDIERFTGNFMDIRI